MRPRSEIRQGLAHALQHGPQWSVQLADRIGQPVPIVRATLDNMCRSGEVTVVSERRVPGSNRPARVYGLVGVGASSSDGEGMNWDLIDCWAKFPRSRGE